MIKYKLICKNCDFTFDSWFASSKEYEKLKSKNFLNCHKCNSQKVEKTLMAPQLINRNSIDNLEKNNTKLNKKKGIYGSATKNEIRELKEEGVEAEMIPWIEDKSN